MLKLEVAGRSLSPTYWYSNVRASQVDLLTARVDSNLPNDNNIRTPSIFGIPQYVQNYTRAALQRSQPYFSPRALQLLPSQALSHSMAGHHTADLLLCRPSQPLISTLRDPSICYYIVTAIQMRETASASTLLLLGVEELDSYERWRFVMEAAETFYTASDALKAAYKKTHTRMENKR